MAISDNTSTSKRVRTEAYHEKVSTPFDPESFEVVRQYVVGSVEMGKGSMPAVEAAFRMIGREVLAGGSPRVDETSTYSFAYGGEQFKVVVNVKDAP